MSEVLLLPLSSSSLGIGEQMKAEANIRREADQIFIIIFSLLSRYSQILKLYYSFEALCSVKWG